MAGAGTGISRWRPLRPSSSSSSRQVLGAAAAAVAAVVVQCRCWGALCLTLAVGMDRAVAGAAGVGPVGLGCHPNGAAAAGRGRHLAGWGVGGAGGRMAAFGSYGGWRHRPSYYYPEHHQQPPPRRGYAATGALRLNRLLFEPGEVSVVADRGRVSLPWGDPRAVHVREVRGRARSGVV